MLFKTRSASCTSPANCTNIVYFKNNVISREISCVCYGYLLHISYNGTVYVFRNRLSLLTIVLSPPLINRDLLKDMDAGEVTLFGAAELLTCSSTCDSTSSSFRPHGCYAMTEVLWIVVSDKISQFPGSLPRINMYFLNMSKCLVSFLQWINIFLMEPVWYATWHQPMHLRS